MLYPPHLSQASIRERSQLLARACLAELQRGHHPDELRVAREQALAEEQYELAQGITEALREFGERPQLGLF